MPMTKLTDNAKLDHLSRSARRCARALEKSGGVVTDAARRLKVSRQAVVMMISRHPELQQIRDEARAVLADEALSGLAKGVRNGDMAAIRTVLLNTAWGRELGFHARMDLNIDSDSIIRVVYAPPQASSDGEWEQRATQQDQIQAQRPQLQAKDVKDEQQQRA